MNINFIEIGNKIRMLRLENDLSQEDLAKMLQVSKSAISQWEKGNGLSIENVYTICKVFCISVDELIKSTENNNFRINADYVNILKKLNVNKILQNNDYNKLKIYCNYTYKLKMRTIALLNAWARNSLSKEDIKEFGLISKIVYFHKEGENFVNFIIASQNGQIEEYKNEIQESIQRKIDDLEFATSDEIEYELSKFFDLHGEIDIIDIIEEKKDIKALKIVLSQMLQHEKDELFTRYIMKKSSLHDYEDPSLYEAYTNDLIVQSSYEFEKKLKSLEFDVYAKVFIDTNCNILYPENSTYEFYIYSIPADFFPNKHMKIEEKEHKYDLFRGWKQMPYREYKNMINIKYTRYLKTLILNRENNPLKYYNDILDIFIIK